jgi:outer membrane protein TolC
LRRSALLLLSGCALAGCSRSYYRQQADAETYPIVSQRVLSPAFDIGRTRLEPAPNSRLADPFNPDATPKPPDDPAAAVFMANPYRFRGARTWGRYGYADAIEPPGWEEALALRANGTLKLDQNSSVEIALANSREYQTALEDVYLSALALTLNRFEFDSQWFAVQGVNYARVGASSLPTESNTLTTDGRAGFTRNLAAGGQLLANFANSFVWEFTGKSQFVTGNFGFQFIQPLLRNFGRDVRLEGLTQAERNTLYSVREFARFRKQFWARTAVQSGGYLDLLLQVQLVRNARENLKAQQRNYDDIQSQYQGNKKSVVEVDQALQGLLGARQQILDTEIGLQNSLDQFKIVLGLPPRLPVELDDRPLDQFVVVAPDTEKLRDEVEQFRLARNKEEGAVPDAESLRRSFDDLAKLAEQAESAVRQAESDLKSWQPLLDRPVRPGDDPEARERAAATYRQAAGFPEEGRKALKDLAAAVVRHRAELRDDTRKPAWEALVKDTKALTEVVDSAIAAQSLARIFRIELPAVDPDEATAIGYAKQNRLDLQNQLALVTDAWRKVIVAANALQSGLSVTAGANLLTAPDARHPFDLSNDASRYAVGLQFEGPLNRLAERNQYRAAQISYQRARRAYMALSDQIEQQVRLNLRSLRQSRTSFEISRQRLIAAARQVENERAQQAAPAAAQPRGGQSRDSTLSTLQALANLNSARNDLAGTFIRYEQQRVQLLLNLEQMQLDARGFPTNAAPPRPDPGPAARPPASGDPTPVALPPLPRE